MLKTGGKFISIAFAQPHFRKPHYARQVFNWYVEQKHFGNNFHYYYYVMQKGMGLSQKDIEKERERVEKRTAEKSEDSQDVKYLEDNELGSCLTQQLIQAYHQYGLRSRRLCKLQKWVHSTSRRK